MSEVNHKAVDRFTVAHAAAGILLGLGRVGPGYAVALAVGWELVENPLKDAFPDVFPHPSHDSFANAAGDVLAMMGAWAFARYVLTPKDER